MTLKLSLPSFGTLMDAPVAAPVATPVSPQSVTAATQERARCRFITQSPHAVGREAFAFALAFKTGMGAQDAVDLLASLPGPAAGSPTVAEEAISWDDVAASLQGVKH